MKGALWLGSFLLFFGVMSFVATFVEGVSWWQYWPVIFVILGIVRMVVRPSRGTARVISLMAWYVFAWAGRCCP